MPGLDRFDGGSLAVLYLGLVAAGAWALFLAYRWIAAFPKMPDAGPVSGELRPEPPAVANLLVHRWSMTGAAVQATILDLAARGHLGVELYAGDNLVLRVRREPDRAEMTDYEERVFRFVKSRATNGSAPIEAVRLEHGASAESWLKSFAKSVASDAKRRGLARNRWTRDEVIQLSATLAVPCLVIGFAFALARIGESVDATTGERDGRWDPIWMSAIAWGILTAGLYKVGDFLRDTPAGRAACAHWLGVKEYLDRAAAFEEAGPAAVTVLGREMAYAAALGVAHDAVEGLPVVPEDPEIAWTRSRGHWRSIKVEYPTRFGFGQPPWKVFLDGLWRSVLTIVIVVVALNVVAAVVEGVYDLLTDFDESTGGDVEGANGLRYLVLFMFAIILAAAAFWGSKGVDGFIRLIRGFLDVGRSRVLEGEVVKVYGGRIAVDNGREAETVAWFPPPGQGCSRGEWVRVHHSPRLWHVSKIERIPRPGQAPDGTS
ncbi:MAG: DUF2207 family protein [Dehalococcoidia bacterium]